MKRVEVPNFIKKIDDETLNSLLKGIESGTTKVYVGDSDKLNEMYKKIKLYKFHRTEPKNKEEVNPRTYFYEQISEREKNLKKQALLEQINYSKKVLKIYMSNLQFIKAHRLVQTIDAFYSDLQALYQIESFSDVYSEDGIDSFVDTVKNMEYKNRAR